MEIDEYNWNEVNDALSHIDARNYPERYNLLLARKNELKSRIANLEDDYEEIIGTKISETIANKISGNKTRGIFSLCAYGLAIPFIILALFAVFGANVVSWNGESSHGIGAILISAFFWLISWLTMSCLLLAGSFVRDYFNADRDT